MAGEGMVSIMMIFLLKITPLPAHRREVLQILNNVQGPTLAMPGCLACGIYLGVADDPAILYLERWRAEADLHYHIQSAVFTKLLLAMELSSIQPEINFYETHPVRGVEMMESFRT
jgi:quinol monooxygenase YgiN